MGAAHQDARGVFMLPQLPSFLAAVLGRCGTPRQPWTSGGTCRSASSRDGSGTRPFANHRHPPYLPRGLPGPGPSQPSPECALCLKWVRALILGGPFFLFRSVLAPPSLLAPRLSARVLPDPQTPERQLLAAFPGRFPGTSSGCAFLHAAETLTRRHAAAPSSPRT